MGFLEEREGELVREGGVLFEELMRVSELWEEKWLVFLQRFLFFIFYFLFFIFYFFLSVIMIFLVVSFPSPFSFPLFFPL